MSIVDRAKNICLTPKTEWPIIAAEPSSTGALLSGYAAPLAAIGAVAGFIGGTFIGYTMPFVGTYRMPLMTGLGAAVVGFVMTIVGIFILSFIINALAPTFSGVKDSQQALKVAVYSYTPALVAGALRVLPALGALVLLAALYGLYLLYLGLPRLMKCPEDKAIGYTAVVVVCAIVVTVVLGAIGAAVGGVGMMGARGLTMGGSPVGSGSSGTVQFDPNSTLGKLQQLSGKLEENSKKMEAAQKSGDANAQAAAAIESLGAIMGGGRKVDPIAVEQLRPFVPETLSGFKRDNINVEKTGIAGLMVSKAEANFTDGAGKSIQLEITDSGGVSGLVGLASWSGLQGQREDQYSTEHTETVNGRLVHEKVSKSGGSNQYGIVLGNRFLVEAEGSGVDIGTLRSAVSSLDLAKLESMKDVGVQK